MLKLLSNTKLMDMKNSEFSKTIQSVNSTF